MARAALPGRLTWHAARVGAVAAETPTVRTIAFDCPGWPGHLPGQHVDVRLTAEDGYQAQRSYSIASAPEDGLALTIERLIDGEVSPYLVDEVLVGDELELRGPIGGYFVWDEPMRGPLLLLGGGSGVVPLRAMLRHRAAMASAVPTRLLYSARGWDELIYREELERLAAAEGGPDVRIALTRRWPETWTGYRRRIDAELLAELRADGYEEARVYICGPSGFVEAAAGGLVALGHDPMLIRTERFGPTS